MLQAARARSAFALDGASDARATLRPHTEVPPLLQSRRSSDVTPLNNFFCSLLTTIMPWKKSRNLVQPQSKHADSPTPNFAELLLHPQT